MISTLQSLRSGMASIVNFFVLLGTVTLYSYLSESKSSCREPSFTFKRIKRFVLLSLDFVTFKV